VPDAFPITADTNDRSASLRRAAGDALSAND
jgi:hypothetical protein